METKRGADVLDPHWTRTDKYGLLNARMALELADGLTEVTLYCTNRLDRRYFTNAFNFGILGTAVRFYAPPRMYGIEVRHEF